jgi:hypothetical protein
MKLSSRAGCCEAAPAAKAAGEGCGPLGIIREKRQELDTAYACNR